MHVLFSEAAASFEELTLSNGVDQMKAQVPDAWPNLFREARFLSAVDFVQADRLRRRVAGEMARIFGEVDLLLVPSLRDEMLTIGNFTGHPSLTFRAGFVQVSEARSDWAPDPAQPAAEVLTTAARAARRDAHRAALRRRHDRPCGRGDGARAGRGARSAGGILSVGKSVRITSSRPPNRMSRPLRAGIVLCLATVAVSERRARRPRYNRQP